jgi:hypothetical protein
MQQVENGRREFGDELAVVCRVAGLRDFDDPRREVLADAGNFPQAGLVEAGEVVGMIGRDVRDIPVRADLERVVVLDLQEVGGFPEDARNRLVIQAASLQPRRGSPEVARPPAASASAIASRAFGGP